jgi:adenylate kinase
VGRKAKAIMEAGQLVPDDVVVGVIAERIPQPDVQQSGFVLDGFPRTVAQAKSLDEMMEKRGWRLDHVIELKVDEKALFERIDKRVRETRAAGGAIRADDNPDTLKKRITVYREQTQPILPYYRAASRLEQVDGMAPIDDVTRQLEAIVDKG